MTSSPARSLEDRRRPSTQGPSLPPSSIASTGLAAAILEATDSLVIVTDIRSGTVVALNKAAESVIGRDRGEVAGVSLWDLCSTRERDAVAGYYAASHFDDAPRTYETTTLDDSGARTRVVWSSTFLTDLAGERTHVVMTGVDVTAGRATSGLFGQLMHAATTMVLIGTDQSGRITFCSAGAEQLLGKPQNDFVGRWLPAAAFGTGEVSAQMARGRRSGDSMDLALDISHHDPGSAHRREAKPGSATEDWESPRDWKVRRADGSPLIAEMTVTQVTDALGANTGYLLMGVDVTEQRRSRDLLVSQLANEEEASQRLQELDRLKNDLVATVSHEIRTPLTSILGYVELLLDEEPGPPTERQEKLMEAVNRNGERLLALVEDLLTVSTIDSGKLLPDASTLDLRDVVSAALRSLRPSIDKRSLTTRFEMPSSPIIVQGDAVQLEQVVCNLVSNAVKFTDDGGRVECALAVDGSRARLTVSDDGIGIPEDEQQGLFTRFFRSSTATNRASQGTGLGLSIASSIVGSHGGDISVVSASGCGTRVQVDLPLAGSCAVL